VAAGFLAALFFAASAGEATSATVHTSAIATDATKASFFNVPSNVGSHVRTVQRSSADFARGRTTIIVKKV
jgi:hypothetical protein